MSEETRKISFREALRISLRGYRIWWGVNQKILLSLTFCAVMEGLSPYVGIYLSAQIINELSGGRDVRKLTTLVMAAIFSAAVIAMLNDGLKRWKNCQHGGVYYILNKIYADKLLSMDFRSIDDQHVHDLLYQIRQNDNMGGWGLRNLLTAYERISKAVVSIIGAAVLTVSLFVLRVPDSAGSLSVLNSSLFIALIIAVMLLITFVAPALSNKSFSYYVTFAEDMRLGNRIHSFFGFHMGAHNRALDVRMYRQDILSLYMIDHYFGFGPQSRIAKAGRGSMGGLSALSGAVSQIFTGVTYVFVCLKALGGAFGIGSVTQYIGAITALSGGLSALVETVGDFRNNAAFLSTAFEFLDTPNDMYQGSLTLEKRSDKKYDIEFCDVSFRYPGQIAYALRNVSMKFTVGQRLAVVGMNGGGKTTFIKLLCRLYDPTEGEILLNGINIRKYNYREYMSIFSVVFQDFKLLAFSLGQNVAAKVSYDGNLTMVCLYGAGFGTRLQKLPLGVETNLYKDFDESGVDISGGEAQKIALARALYKEAAFIILDEPTAALDPVAEFEVYNKMNEIVSGKTAVFISHRLSSCRFCQNIVVFNEGRLVQRGSHEELIADKKGKYYELWNAQAQYYTV